MIESVTKKLGRVNPFFYIPEHEFISEEHPLEYSRGIGGCVGCPRVPELSQRLIELIEEYLTSGNISLERQIELLAEKVVENGIGQEIAQWLASKYPDNKWNRWIIKKLINQIEYCPETDEELCYR